VSHGVRSCNLAFCRGRPLQNAKLQDLTPNFTLRWDMPLSFDKLSRMAAHQERLQREKVDALAIRKAHALEEVQALVEKFLLVDPGITKVILFGSLARDDVSSLDSDIDLAIACSGERFLALVAIAQDSPFKVDLVELSTADNRIKDAIAREGVVLYEQ
jgi:predicted nucleotidyltransferase